MTSIGSLLSPALKQTLMAAVEANESVRDDVHVTVINGVEYDVRSEAMAETTCADCPQALRVVVSPVGVDLDMLTSHERVAVCEPCGRKRVAGKRGVLIHHNPKEAIVAEFDLTQFSEAAVARLAVEARDRMVRDKAAALPEKRDKAAKKEAKRIAKDQALKEQQREERKNLVLPGLSLTIKGQHRDVPALDLSEVTDMNEIVAPAMRSPYNKALYALGKDVLDKDAATYAVVAETHAMLMEHADAPAQFEALATVVKPDGKAKADRKAKIEAYAEVMGVTKKQARKHLEKVGVL